MKRTGGINIGCIIMAIVVALAGYAAYCVIPVKVKAAEFEKEVESFALQAAAQGAAMSDDKIINSLLNKAEELDLPITEKDITIRRGSMIRIEAEYAVTVNILGYEFDMNFNPSYENPLF
jgi:hypothetical protein